MLPEKVKKIQTTVDNLSIGGHEDREKMCFILWKGEMTSGIILPIYPYNLPCRRKKSKYPFLLRHLYRYLETLTDHTGLFSLV